MLCSHMMNFSKTFDLTEDRASLYKTLARNTLRKFPTNLQNEDFNKLCNEILNFTPENNQYEKFSSLCLKMYCSKDICGTSSISKKYQDLMRNLSSKITIREESRYVSLLTSLSVIICVNYPQKSLQKHISESIYYEKIKILCDKMCELCKIKINEKNDKFVKSDKLDKSAYPDDSQSSIASLFDNFISVIQIIYFTAAFFILNYLTYNVIDNSKKQVLLYFSSFYLSVIGDLFKYSENESTRDFSVEFYILSTKIWPKYSRPYKCIANWHFSKSLFQETFYFYACSFLCMTGAERFSIARQELSVFTIAVSEKVKLWQNRLKDKQSARLFNKISFKNFDLYIFFIKRHPYVIFQNSNKFTILNDFQYNFYEFCIETIPSLQKEAFTTLINLFVYDFLFITLKMINRTDLTELSEDIDKWRACFNTLRLCESFYRSEFFDSFPTFAIILIYTMENILYETSIESNKSSILISLFIKLFLIFNDNVVYLLVKLTNENLILPLMKFLSFTLRCFGCIIESPIVKSILFKESLECNTFFHF